MEGIGEVNTLLVNDANELIGYNTDHQAALDSLDETLAAALCAAAENLDDQTTLVLGQAKRPRPSALG